MAVVLVAFIYLFVLYFFVHKDVGLITFAKAVVKTNISIFLFVALTTELLSYFNIINYTSLLLVWSIFFVVCSIFFLKEFRYEKILLSRDDLLNKSFSGESIAIFIILFLTFITALVYPPTTCDSMTYHMARIVHWINNGSVMFYTTNISRQNYQMPLAEFAIMHLQILSGGDMFSNLVQWICFVGIVCLSISIASIMGLKRKGQLIAGLLSATLPMGIMQATSTQNDIVVSFFLMAFVYFMLCLLNKLNFKDALFAACSFGLALLTKGTGYIYGLAIGVVLSVILLYKWRKYLFRIFCYLSGIVIFAFVINLGHLLRNYNLYGNIFSDNTGSYNNTEFSVIGLLSNLLRNIAMHLAVPVARINAMILKVLEVILGPELNNPNTTWHNYDFTISYVPHEDHIGNIFHTILLLCFFPFLLHICRKNKYNYCKTYIIMAMVSACLYCLILKWQPWGIRLQSPLFFIGSPILAIVIVEISKFNVNFFRAKINIGNIVLLFFISYAFIFCFYNPSRPLISKRWITKDRFERCFASNYGLYKDYNGALKYISEQSMLGVVGLYIGVDDWEYPLWAYNYNKNASFDFISFKHVGVDNESRILFCGEDEPLYVLSSRDFSNWEHSYKYRRVYLSESISVFEKTLSN